MSMRHNDSLMEYMPETMAGDHCGCLVGTEDSAMYKICLNDGQVIR